MSWWKRKKKEPLFDYKGLKFGIFSRREEEKKKRERLKKQLDDVVREITRIRDNYTCQKCGKQQLKGLHPHHIFTRGKDAVRWDKEDIITLCFHCHRFWGHSRIQEFLAWVKLWMGPTKYDLLEYRASKKVKFTIGELELLLIDLKRQLMEAQNGEEHYRAGSSF